MSYAVGDTKRFLKDRTNMSILLIICVFALQIFNTGLQCYNTNKLCKKIDHRYFNTTNSLENIHNVNINTRDGSIRR